MTPFSLILNLFDTSFSQNLRSDWVHFLNKLESQGTLLYNFLYFLYLLLYLLIPCHTINTNRIRHFICIYFPYLGKQVPTIVIIHSLGIPSHLRVIPSTSNGCTVPPGGILLHSHSNQESAILCYYQY